MVNKYVLTLALTTLVGLEGCSATIPQNTTNNEWFPRETKVYTVPADSAYAKNFVGYPDSLTLKQIVGKNGKETYTSNFSIKKDSLDDYAKKYPQDGDLGLVNRVKNMGIENIATNNFLVENEVKTQKTTPKGFYTPEQSQAKQKTSTWDNIPTWVKVGAPIIIGVGLGYLISKSGKHDKKGNKYDLPEPPEYGGVGGGRTEEGAEIGGVRGGSDRDNEIGGARE